MKRSLLLEESLHSKYLKSNLDGHFIWGPLAYLPSGRSTKKVYFQTKETERNRRHEAFVTLVLFATPLTEVTDNHFGCTYSEQCMVHTWHYINTEW